MTGLPFTQTAKGYLPVQPSPWKRGPSTWRLSQTPWTCRMMPLCWTSIYKWKRQPPEHVSGTWTQPWEGTSPTAEFLRRTGLNPSTHSKTQLDLEARKMPGSLGPWPIRRWMWKSHTVPWVLLLADHEDLHDLCLSRFSTPWPITLLDWEALFSYRLSRCFILHA